MSGHAALKAALAQLAPDTPVLIAGPTASGKSALALWIAQTKGGVIVNADALQVYAHWRVLTARPSTDEEARAPHRLYGHIAPDQPYSTGVWLREVEGLLAGKSRPIIVGGTGLYFNALTDGLSAIPEISADVRSAGDALRLNDLPRMISELDPASAARIDLQNPARVQRAWEVLRQTGTGLAHWQDTTPPPLLPPASALPICVDAPKDWLSPRIAQRFEMMIDGGALEEVRANAATYDPARPGDKAIGAPELMAYLAGDMTLEAARDRAIIATRQYAKRQRTWFKSRMRDWLWVEGAALGALTKP